MNPLIQSASLPDFLAQHATQEACLARIRERRWPQGFVCPHCRHAGGYALPGRRGFECIGCGRQTSVTSGTAFAFFKLPLPKVFLAMYLISANKQGISGKSLAKHVGCSGPTAWHLLHKLRHAMQERDEGYRLAGLIEVDEAYVGGLAAGAGVRGRSTKHKTPVLAMVEKMGDNLTGYIALRPVADVTSKSLLKVIGAKIQPGAQIRTDALSSYTALTQRGFVHRPEVSLGGKRSAIQFKLVHRQISNLKSWLLGTHRNTCRRHLDLYTAEFSWRTNRRNRYRDAKPDGQEQTITDRLLTAMVASRHWAWTKIRKHRWTRRKMTAA
ncbi:MAG: IS1595 family transposase [Planctomycetes bacterium]|nr:IS1595 family transposase [Planctomycetota bacterium]